MKKDFYIPQSSKDLCEGYNKSSKKNLSDLYDNEKGNKYIYHSSINNADNISKKNLKEFIYNNYRLNSAYNNLKNRKDILNKIRANKLCTYFNFCFINNNNNINNIFFYEGMKLIMENLDIFNVFRRLYELSKFERMISKEEVKDQMSDESK